MEGESMSRGWRTARTCDGGACIEVTAAAPGISVRDTQDRDGFRLGVTAQAWTAFLAAVKAA